MFASGWLTNLLCSVEQLNRREWLDRGDGVLIDELRLPISRKQNAEAVEHGHVALELDAVHKKHCHRNPMILKVPEEHLLDRLDPLYCHGEFPFLALATAATAGALLQIIVPTHYVAMAVEPAPALLCVTRRGHFLKALVARH
jgi:hypothetical protein